MEGLITPCPGKDYELQIKAITDDTKLIKKVQKHLLLDWSETLNNQQENSTNQTLCMSLSSYYWDNHQSYFPLKYYSGKLWLSQNVIKLSEINWQSLFENKEKND